LVLSSTTDIVRDNIEKAIADGRMGDRLWLYATYHCNLACVYCLTESHPRIADRRRLTDEAMVRAAWEARELGFTCVGITGGEPFILPSFPETLAEIASILPTVALTNGTLVTDRLLSRLEPLADADAALQISLDSDVPERNDGLRGPENFAKVVEAVPKLVERGIRVRIATTVDGQDPAELEGVCALHRRWGIPGEDHVVRSVVRRGRADVEGIGVVPGENDILPELTLTADGAFLHPFAPTVRHGVTDLDLLVSRQIAPLEHPTRRFLQVVAELPVGEDVVRNIR
jgi:MoaA/NifB/PqqE/SkfB family radical SAM enzyme